MDDDKSDKKDSNNEDEKSIDEIVEETDMGEDKEVTEEKVDSSDDQPVEDDSEATTPRDNNLSSSNLPEPPVIAKGKSERPKLKVSKKKLMIIVLVLLILGGGAAAAYLVLGKDKKADSTVVAPEQETPVEPEEIKEAIPMLEGVAYAHKDVAGANYTFFSRSIPKADRAEIGDVSNKDLFYLSTFDSGYVYIAGSPVVNEIWTGTPSTLPKKIFTNEDKDTYIYNVRATKDGNTIYFATLDNELNPAKADENRNAIWKINKDGSNPVKVLEKKAAVIAAASDDKLIFQEIVPNSDAPAGDYTLLNLSDKSTKVLFELDDYTQGEFAVNEDFSEVMYSVLTKSGETQEGFPAIGAPFMVHQLDLATLDDKLVATVGKKGDRDGPAEPTVNVGWAKTDNGEVPYYSYAADVIFIEDGKETKYFTSESGNIKNVYWATGKEILVGIGLKDLGENVVHYDVAGKKASAIMETSEYTKILGFTFQ